MPISEEICRAEQKYMPFLGPSPFFPQKALGDGPGIWIFFKDSRIRVKVKSEESIAFIIHCAEDLF